MTEPSVIKFTRGVPAEESFPIEEVANAAATVVREHGAQVLQYGPSTGFPPMRGWLANWQGVNTDQILTANGSLQLIEFMCLAMIKPGDVVFTEVPTYDRTITMLRRYGARIVGIPLEPDGPNMERLEEAVKKERPVFFYLIPDFQNPSGATCSLSKRRRLVELAEKYGFLLFEDAPYRLLRYRGKEEPTLYSLAPHRTLHMTSFTKLLGPGVRTGLMVGEAGIIAKLAKIAEDTYISPGYLGQAVTWEWCKQGGLEPQIERLKKLYAPRLMATLQALEEFLPDAETTRPDGGFFISLKLRKGISSVSLREEAKKRGLELSDGTGFFPDKNGDEQRFVRLPFCALTPNEITLGVRRLGESVMALK